MLENESLVNLKVFQNINKREVIFSYSKLKLASIEQQYYFGDLQTKINHIQNQKKQVLRQNFNFKNLKQDEFQKFVENSTIKQVSEQQQLIKVDQKYLFIYFISEGEVQMLKDKNLVFTFSQNSVFGDETLSDNNISQYDYICSKNGILIQIDILKLISQLAITSLTRYKIYDIFQNNFNVRQLQIESFKKPKLLKKESFENDYPQKLRVKVSTMLNLEEVPQQKPKEDESFFKILKKNQFKTDQEIVSLENQDKKKSSCLKSSMKINNQEQKIKKNVKVFSKQKTIEEIDEQMSDLVSQQSLQESEMNLTQNQIKFIQIKQQNNQQEAQKISNLNNNIDQIKQQEKNYIEQKQNSNNYYYIQQKDKKVICQMPNIVKNLKIPINQVQVEVNYKKRLNKQNNYSLDQQYFNIQDNNKLNNSQLTQNTRQIDMLFKDSEKKSTVLNQFLNPLKSELIVQKNINFVNSKYSKKQNHISINQDLLDSTSIEIIQKHKQIEQRKQSDDINQIRIKLNQIVQNKNTQQTQAFKDNSVLEELIKQQQNISKNYINKSKIEKSLIKIPNEYQGKNFIQ